MTWRVLAGATAWWVAACAGGPSPRPWDDDQAESGPRDPLDATVGGEGAVDAAVSFPDAADGGALPGDASLVADASVDAPVSSDSSPLDAADAAELDAPTDASDDATSDAGTVCVHTVCSPADGGAYCAALVADSNNCGTCGSACSSDTRCVGGACRSCSYIADLPGYSLPAPEYPRAVAGDLNGDGKDDIAIVSSRGELQVLLNNGYGGFEQTTTYPLAVGSPLWSDVAIADLDGDGQMDVVTAGSSYSYPEDRVGVFLNAGGGALKPPAVYDAGYSGRRGGLRLLDLNGDGKVDVFYALENTVNVLLNAGAGKLSPRKYYPASKYVGGAALADFNGDGKPDVVSSSLDWGDIGIQLNDGSGGFGARVAFAVPASALAVGDVNGDGMQDVVAAGRGVSDGFDVLLGNGAGGLSAPQHHPGPLVRDVALADANGDGKKDLLLTSVAGNVPEHALRVFLNDGAATFATSTAFATGTDPDSLAVGDFNGDGKRDVLVATRSPSVDLFVNEGAGAFRTMESYPSPVMGLVAALDVNGDGRSDVVVADRNGTPQIAVHLGKPDGSLGAPSLVPASAFVEQLIGGDITNDGKPELLTLDLGAGGAKLYENLGGGSFATAQQLAPGPGLYRAAIGDLNGDGVNDVAISVLDTGTLLVFMNDGKGHLLPRVDYAIALPYLSIADVTGDGIGDVVGAGSHAIIVPGSATGILGKARMLPEVIDGILAVTDVSGDGRADLVTLDPQTKDPMVLFADGRGGFAARTYPTGLGGACSVGDVTGDRMADFICFGERNFDGSHVYVMVNDGAGGFGPPRLFAKGRATYAPAFADINGDGLGDMIVSSLMASGEMAVSVLRSRGLRCAP